MWFYAALGMSFVSGIIVVTSKHVLKSISPLVFYWASITASIPIIAFFAFKNPVPSLNSMFWVGVIGSVVFYTIGRLLFLNAIKNSELPHVHPLVALGPILTLYFSSLVFGETTTFIQILGSAITIVGVYVLNISSLREGMFEPFKILIRNRMALLMIASVVFGSVVSVFDKLAIINTFPENSMFALLVEDLVIMVMLAPYILYKKQESFPELRLNARILLVLGVLGAISNILAFIAIGDGNPGLVATVFRTQIFFTLFFSAVYFKDIPKGETIFGSLIMLLGLAVLKLGS